MELDNQSPETIEYKAISGEFGEVRYFITTLDQSDAVENIRFADEIQGSWSFSERVQRKLDENRANTDIFSYLAQGGIRFFNSIVVILLPNSNDQREFWDFSTVSSQGKIVEKWVNLKLYKNVARIVIDGQHRLLSLRRYWNAHTGKEPLSSQQINDNFSCLETFDIPVVYLVFGNLGRVGHADLSETVRDEIIKATRNIFTVINKTAKSIDKPTQLLLDDSKISALIPRKLLEEGVLEDRFVKWSDTTRSLNQQDPYLTTLDFLSQCTVELLKDHQKQALKKSFNSPNERNMALETYYESHPKLHEIGTKGLLKWFFTELQPFKDWVSQIDYVGINIPLQPEQPRLTTSQKASIKQLRGSNILYTLIGQRILFFAVSRFLLKIRIEYRIPEILDAILLSITKMYEDGFFNRNKAHWSNVLVQPNEKLAMITKNSGVEKCIELLKMILLDSSDGVRELIKRTKENVSNEVNWNEVLISNWRREFHVILPKVDFIDEQIKESSESDDSFAEVRDLLDFSEEEEEESEEIEDDDDIFKETE
ncbi:MULTISPECIES: DNA sulfur modification protein DndB [unclassified Nostoc]|uniref:DNA sulfur modification protein DndB n=1 Tax=unclassified Nostoc TaxID=2593658 RepID=UPI002AD43CC5|nr:MULTISPECIES: DNA sulfur modification protein DndB [unclassified Nostoc]MDZ8126855.1 DNA sulfur modification protein DndB [Nostoc sp. CmiVER01]MDZ8222823.1 DNA sulfur modification protein DndB [Nostoc sp. ChiVER01]